MKNRSYLQIAAMVVGLSGGFTAEAGRSVKQPNHPNILFISVDDLRTELNCYGATHIQSPHIDRLAKEGLLMERAYCNFSVCGASRASLMTGLRPTDTRFLNYHTWAEKDAPGVMDIPSCFKQAGYRTVLDGKIYHNPTDNTNSWDECYVPKYNGYYFNADNLARIADPKIKIGLPYEAADQPDEVYQGGMVAQKAIEELRRAKESGKPVFIGAGFTKPHLPFNCPKKYWDLYPAETIKLPATYREAPKDSPIRALSHWGELRSFYGVPKEGPVSDKMALNLIRGYYACTTFTDTMIGRIFAEMDRLKLWDNTIVILWGDHGWQLGDHTLWCKHSCFNVAEQAPLIISAPGFKKGVRTKALIEFVDIYPTLCDLAGIEQSDHLDGKSFVPLMKEPDLKWKDAVFSRYQKGVSIRTDRYLYTEYYADGVVTDRMLYDHEVDPDETVNISELPENAALVQSLSIRLREGHEGMPPLQN